MHTVLETEQFLKASQASGMSESERFAIVNAIAENPTIGDVIEGTGGARKVRFAARNRGKSAGYRVITFFTGEDLPVFLMDVFTKGEKVNLSKAERNELKGILAQAAAEFRATAKRKLSRIPRRAS